MDAGAGTTRRGVPAWVWPAVLFVVLAWPVIFSGFARGRGAHDQLNYHEQAVRRFAEQWPGLDYSDYQSATTPGYHTLLTVVAKFVDDDRVVLQLAGSLFAVGLVALLGWGVRWHGSPGVAGGSAARAGGSVVLVLPVVVSMPVFYSGVWMLPDDAGWLGVLAVWLLALRPRFDWVAALGGGAVLALLIFVRQIHLWPMALLLTAAWLGACENGDGGFDLGIDLRELLSAVPARLGRVALALCAAAPAAFVLVWFYLLWGHRLTPPAFEERHMGGNPTAPAFVLAVFGMYGVLFVPYLLDGLRRLWVRQTWLLGLAVVVGLVLACVAPTTWSLGAGRYSGLWDIAKHLPAPLGRSVVVVPLAVLGAVLLAAWFVSLGRRDRWIMLAAMVAFTAAQCASFKLWQRYTEPMVLVWLALAAARVAPAPSAAGQGWRVVAPGVLALGLAGVTAASLVVARPVRARAMLFPWETEAPILPGMLDSDRQERDRNDDQSPISRSGIGAPEGRSSPTR